MDRSQRLLFRPIKLRDMEVKNRFVHSATYEAMAEDGAVTEALINRYRTLAKGEIGLIIPGYMYVHPLGRTKNSQMGIHNDAMIPGLRRLVETIHQADGKVVFQLVHVGRQTTKDVIGETPMAPSRHRRDPSLFFVKPRAMTEEDIQVVIESFGHAARRAVAAGADGVQIHGAHGYLINEFLSPFFNRRRDAWGGSEENMFRFLKEVFGQIRAALPEGMPLMIKLNTNDHTPDPGITPDLARTYIAWLAEMGIDAVENSCGSGFSFMSAIRGDVPVDELVMMHSSWKKLLSRISLQRMVGKFDVYDGYNLEDSKAIKPALGEIPLMAVGGMRKVSHMEEVLEKGDAHFISICRPFIREPFLVKRIREGKTDEASCEYCNKCFGAIAHELPLRCYYKDDFRELLQKTQP